MKLKFVAALLVGSALTISAPAFAQEPAPAPQDQPEPTEPDQSDAAADAAIQSAQAVDDAQAKIELLQAQVEALQASIEQIKTGMVKATPSWKGAPFYEDKEAGWSFKPRGRIQYDVGYVSNPDDTPNGGLLTRNLGFNTRARRLRLGVEGTVPGGFGYKAEMDFANASVGFGDVILTYTPTNSPFNVAVGNQETNNGLEQISSSRWSSFVERAAFDDAFVNTRHLGVNLGYVNKAGDLRLNAGLWAGHSIDGTLDDDGWIAAARGVYAPKMGANQLHFGLNYQHRKFQSNNNQTASTSAGRASTNQVARYRARPYSQLTDVRFVDTGNFAAKSDDIIGVEAAGIFKSLHIAAEGQYLKSRVGYDPGDFFASGDLDQFVFNSPSGCSGSACLAPVYVLPDGNPSFWGGYVEAGYFVTGETRGYKNGTWDRTKVLNPFSKGGLGAFQVVGRVDYLNLDTNKLHEATNNNFLTGAFSTTNNYTRGGKMLGLQAGLTWIPEDYVRVLFNYSHAFVTGGPLADEVSGLPTSDANIADVDYGVDVFQTRIQLDF
jgi:phosphate-selective porin OprO and OprP